MKNVLALSLVLLLIGCTPTRVIETVETADKVAEPQVDASINFLETRSCNLPMDVQLRRIQRDAYKALALYYNCPVVRSFMLVTLEALGQAGLSVTVDVQEREAEE